MQIYPTFYYRVQKIFYSIKSDSGILSAADVTPPTAAAITTAFTNSGLHVTLTVVDTSTVTTLTILEKTFTGSVLGQLVTDLQAHMTTAWTSAGKIHNFYISHLQCSSKSLLVDSIFAMIYYYY